MESVKSILTKAPDNAEHTSFSKRLHKPSLSEKLSEYASHIATEFLENPVNEIDALASLLAMAEYLPDEERFGYDVDKLNAIVLRRIRTVARACRNRVATIIDGDEPDREGVDEY